MTKLPYQMKLYFEKKKILEIPPLELHITVKSLSEM